MNSRKRERWSEGNFQRGDCSERKWMSVFALHCATHCRSARSGWITALLLFGLCLLIDSWRRFFLLGLTWSKNRSNYPCNLYTQTHFIILKNLKRKWQISLFPLTRPVLQFCHIKLPILLQHGNYIQQTRRKTDPTILQPLSLLCFCQMENHAYHRYPSGLLFDTFIYASLYHSLPYLSRGWEQQGTSDRLIRAELQLTTSRWSPLKLHFALWVYVDAYVDCSCLSVSKSKCIHSF